MKKNNIRGYIILGIIFILITIIAFAIPSEKTAAFWVSYIFTIIAIAAQVVIWKVAFGKNNTLKSKFLGLPIIHIGIVYLIIQVIAFFVFKFITSLPMWVSVVVCIAIICISALCLIATDSGKVEIKNIENNVQKKVFYIREIQSEIELLANTEPDDAVKTDLIKLSEKVRFSDPMSNDQLEDIESEIIAKVSELKTTSEKTKVINELGILLEERNKKCKILK